MHRHQDGKHLTPKATKVNSTNTSLHGHGPDYTLAENVAGHTHINKKTKARTSEPTDQVPLDRQELPLAYPADEPPKPAKKKTSKKVGTKKKAAKRKTKK